MLINTVIITGKNSINGNYVREWTNICEYNLTAAHLPTLRITS